MNNNIKRLKGRPFSSFKVTWQTILFVDTSLFGSTDHQNRSVLEKSVESVAIANSMDKRH